MRREYPWQDYTDDELLRLRSTELLVALVRLPERAKGGDPDAFVKQLI